MPLNLNNKQFRWFRAILLTLVGGAIVLYGVRLIPIEWQGFSFPDPFVIIPAGSQKQILDEQACLYDSTPLFLPTAWNYRYEKTITVPPLAFFTYKDYTPDLEKRFAQYLELNSEASDTDLATYVLSSHAGVLFNDMGKSALTLPPLTQRLGLARILSFAQGEAVKEIALPSKKDSSALMWERPLECLLYVDALSPFNNCVPLTSSGSEVVDKYIYEALQKNLRDIRLPAGTYTISVGP